MAPADNPYQSPESTNGAQIVSSSEGNYFGFAGLVLSIIASVGLFAVGFPPHVKIGAYLSFLSIPGIALSVVGSFRAPRRFAIWGIAIGVFVALYLPSLSVGLFVFKR
jgi:hypothetical protein